MHATPRISLRDVMQRADEVVATVVEPGADEWDRAGEWPESAMRALQRAGLAGLVVPQSMGGLGHALASLTRVCETLGRADASTALCFGMHSVATACIAANATGDQMTRYITPIVLGKHITTLALSEPGTGSHFYLPELRMDLVGDMYRLSGTKSFVTNGGHADSYVLSTVAAGPDAVPGHFSMLVVAGDTDGLRWEGEWTGWGMRGNSARTLQLDGVLAHKSNRLGGEGEQIWYVFNVVAPYFLVAMAGTYLGVADRAVAEARLHLKNRTYSHSGRSLAENQILQNRLGRVWSDLQRARRLCYWAAAEADRDGPDALPALCSAKAEVATACTNTVNECMTLAGGRGYAADSILQRLLRDARAAHVMSPTTDMLYTWAGRALLDIPLLGE